MIKILKKAILLLLIINLSNCSTSNKDEENKTENFQWEDLMVDNLSKWDTYLSFKHEEDYNGDPPTDKEGNLIEPIGMNKPGYNVFNLTSKGKEKIIHVRGEYYGGLISKKRYSNYHFQLKVKWGEQKWVPRQNKLKDSGILYHSIGKPGVEHWRSWMMSQEFQIMEGHTGDYWSQATSAIDIRAYPPESKLNPVAHESQDFLPIGEGSIYKNYCLRSNNYENPHGEWDKLDLICYEGKSLHIVNDHVVMILKNSRYINEEGEEVPMTRGKIQLQSEAAELYFKDIKIRTLDSLSSEYAKYF